MDQESASHTVVREGQVATVTITAPKHRSGGTSDLHWELANTFGELRAETDIRVIVLTGSHGEFYVPMPPEFYRSQKAFEYLGDPPGAWLSQQGVIRVHQNMAEIEKPIIAKVNGPAIGFGSSLVLACDLIVADQDTRVVDMHLGMGEVEEGGPDFGIVPGDGGAALAPLFMSPVLAKEFLMLARPFTGAELEARGIINYALPADEIDAKVAELIERLLLRPAYALAWTKRVASRHVADQLNRTLDSGIAYEMINFLQLHHGQDGGEATRKLQ
jgi:enoyl-CoA hydratase